MVHSRKAELDRPAIMDCNRTLRQFLRQPLYDLRMSQLLGDIWFGKDAFDVLLGDRVPQSHTIPHRRTCGTWTSFFARSHLESEFVTRLFYLLSGPHSDSHSPDDGTFLGTSGWLCTEHFTFGSLTHHVECIYPLVFPHQTRTPQTTAG